MTQPNQDRRAEERRQFIQGLRELADWYEKHPELPAPPYPDLLFCSFAKSDEDGVAEIRLLADAMGVDMRPPGMPYDTQQHYTAKRQFAGLEFRASYIPQARKNHRVETLAPGDTVVRAESAPATQQAGCSDHPNCTYIAGKHVPASTPLDVMWPASGAPVDADVDPHDASRPLVEPAPLVDKALADRDADCVHCGDYDERLYLMPHERDCPVHGDDAIAAAIDAAFGGDDPAATSPAAGDTEGGVA